MITLLQKLFRIMRPCRMPQKAVSLLESEGLLVLQEKIRIVVIFKNFKAPYRRHSYKSSIAFGSFGLSSRRIMAFSFFKMIVHTTYDEPKFKSITFSNRKDKYLSLSFDASEFHQNQSGQIEIRFFLSNVNEAIHILQGFGASILDVVKETTEK